MSDRALARALALARDALGAAPAGLLTDLDGTLAPIVGDPDAVRPVEGAADALERLATRLAVVGIITGRAAAAARRIAGVPRLLVVGNHGTEWLEPLAEAASPTPGLEEVPVRLARALAGVPREPGITVEEKGLSATIHYRAAGDPAAARRRILHALAAARVDGLEVREGRMSVEIRPAGAGDKGSATRQVADRYRLRGLVVLGDDVTDLDMFRAAAALREAGGLRAAIIAVGGGEEVPGEVTAAADAALASPDEAVEFLRALLGD